MFKRAFEPYFSGEAPSPLRSQVDQESTLLTLQVRGCANGYSYTQIGKEKKKKISYDRTGILKN